MKQIASRYWNFHSPKLTLREYTTPNPKQLFTNVNREQILKFTTFGVLIPSRTHLGIEMDNKGDNIKVLKVQYISFLPNIA